MNKYIIKEAEVEENVYDEDSVVVGADTYIKHVVYDRATDTPITQFNYEYDAIEWCKKNDPDGVYTN